jgi:3-hydroxyacyl-CoA dehydrogenase
VSALPETEVIVVGTGLMGAGLAQAFAQNGVGVGLVGRRRDSLDRALGFVGFELEEAVRKGIYSGRRIEEIRHRIYPTINLEEACRGKNLRLVIESVSENIRLKTELFNRLDEFCAPSVVPATNTSCLDAELLAAAFITAAEVDRLCQAAFLWPKGPFALMNQVGVGPALELVTEKMELSHRQEISFPVPRFLTQQARKNEPWPL